MVGSTTPSPESAARTATVSAKRRRPGPWSRTKTGKIVEFSDGNKAAWRDYRQDQEARGLTRQQARREARALGRILDLNADEKGDPRDRLRELSDLVGRPVEKPQDNDGGRPLRGPERVPALTRSVAVLYEQTRGRTAALVEQPEKSDGAQQLRAPKLPLAVRNFGGLYAQIEATTDAYTRADGGSLRQSDHEAGRRIRPTRRVWRSLRRNIVEGFRSGYRAGVETMTRVSTRMSSKGRKDRREDDSIERENVLQNREIIHAQLRELGHGDDVDRWEQEDAEHEEYERARRLGRTTAPRTAESNPRALAETPPSATTPSTPAPTLAAPPPTTRAPDEPVTEPRRGRVSKKAPSAVRERAPGQTRERKRSDEIQPVLPASLDPFGVNPEPPVTSKPGDAPSPRRGGSELGGTPRPTTRRGSREPRE